MIPLVCVPDAKLDEIQKERLARVLLEDQGVDISRAGAPLALDLDANPDVAAPLIAGLRAAGALAKVGLDPSVFSVDDRRDVEGNHQKPPFPGLESFGDTDADAAIFYGRSPEIVQVIEDLREFRAGGERLAYAHAGRAYVIQGASGSGKSSLLKAGVLPRLRRERGWVALRSFRPGADPLLNFAEALVKPIEGRNTNQAQGAIRDRLLNHWRTAKSSAEEARTLLVKSLPTEARTAALNAIDLELLRTLRRQLDAEITPLKLDLDRPAATALITIDQGEELVRAEGDSANALADYVKAALLRATDGSPTQYAIVLTVRSDSFPELQASPRLEGLATRPFDLRSLPIYRFADAIEKPASRYGVEIEPQLVEMLMDDAGGRDALPLLAFTLRRLWQQYEAERRIRKVNYESIGRILGLIEDAAERALRGIDPGAQQGPLAGKVSYSRDAVAQRVFVPTLAQINERGATMRRVATLSGFDDEGREMLSSFEKWRLIVTNGDNVEVAHEALFRAWPRFLRWLEPERARLETLRSLESAAASWDWNARGYDFITHAGRRLRNARALMKVADFRKYIDRTPSVGAYLKAAAHAQRGWRIATWFSVAYVSTAAVVVVLVIGAVALKYPKYLPLAFMLSSYAIFCAILVPFFSYCAAIFRQIALRSRFHSDIIVLSLIIVLSSFILYKTGSFSFSMFSPEDEIMGRFQRQQMERQNAEGAKTFFQDLDDKAIGTFFKLALSPFLVVLIPMLWAAIEGLWLVTIPFSFIARKLAGRLKWIGAVPSQQTERK
jgi:hypothetical protein